MTAALNAEGILFAESLGKESLKESPGLSMRFSAVLRRAGFFALHFSYLAPC
jgi:hypothetical protein